jgi:hypothetical protein
MLRPDDESIKQAQPKRRCLPEYTLQLGADSHLHALHRKNIKYYECCFWSSESFGMYCRVFNWMTTDVSEVRAASIIMVISHHHPDDGGSTHLWNVGRHPIRKTRQYIPEDSDLHTRRRENLKPHNVVFISKYWGVNDSRSCEERSLTSMFYVTRLSSRIIQDV